MPLTKEQKQELITSGYLPTTSVAIQAIAFDKTQTTNWKVAWHQDITIAALISVIILPAVHRVLVR